MYLSDISYLNNSKIKYQRYLIFIIVIYFITLTAFLIPYHDYNTYSLYIVDSKYQLVVDDDFFPVYKTYFYLDRKLYDYKILNISKKSGQYILTIDVSLKDIYKKNNIMSVKIKGKKRSLFKRFLNSMKG